MAVELRSARSVPDVSVPFKWRATRWLLRHIVISAARRGLADRELLLSGEHAVRWIAPDINRFLVALEEEIEILREDAELSELRDFGNRLMVELALYTVAADRVLRRSGVTPASSRNLVADIGWVIYRRMLLFASLPVRVMTRDPGRRIRWTISILLRFPFSAPGAPGYAVDAKNDGDDIHTHFTHCPPQTFVRRLGERQGDAEALETFKRSWCLFDWAGADLIAGDGIRGHYTRSQTLSHGDPVCDMCWRATGRHMPDMRTGTTVTERRMIRGAGTRNPDPVKSIKSPARVAVR